MIILIIMNNVLWVIIISVANNNTGIKLRVDTYKLIYIIRNYKNWKLIYSDIYVKENNRLHYMWYFIKLVEI